MGFRVFFVHAAGVPSDGAEPTGTRNNVIGGALDGRPDRRM